MQVKLFEIQGVCFRRGLHFHLWNPEAACSFDAVVTDQEFLSKVNAGKVVFMKDDLLEADVESVDVLIDNCYDWVYFVRRVINLVHAATKPTVTPFIV